MGTFNVSDFYFFSEVVVKLIASLTISGTLHHNKHNYPITNRRLTIHNLAFNQVPPCGPAQDSTIRLLPVRNNKKQQVKEDEEKVELFKKQRGD